ncbi:aspartate aminotransferase family protein [Micromonospora halophytica]|uniref:Glutamate-1-semialdehyde 2,1-aminomutase n=1 Tax=Micromonospora halophytica TaxID=47864 RepID=A0A1C5IMM3_9ACTN|nr:aminotransferase class III-fold pyridoxal phosphate-dependent enzyme [Micromonospora halophytica]SCG59269.1 glutamate-1-semialdehyde 2,1-aminomutase [Micromonospora halophytica]
MTGAAPLDLSESAALRRRAVAVDATLAYEGYVLQRDRLVDGAYPLFGERASGAHVWDVDGNRYLDLILAYGTIILGHADPVVSEAVVREIRDGFAITLRKRVQVELAELLTAMIPHAEKVFLLKTGSDATSAAVRLSRVHTGRDRVIRWGYNGWHDWCATRPGGVPPEAQAVVDTFDYNDLDSLRRVFEKHPGQTACLLMMPFEVEPPAPGFLAGAAELAREHGALFVLDEMRSGFRMAPGGAQERYDVRADLVTFSKAMANGYPIAALVGREEVMRAVGEVHISSTFHVNGAEMAAAVATINQLRDGRLLTHVERLGERLQAGLRDQLAGHGVPGRVLGVPQMPFLRFTDPDEATRTRAHDAFYTETTRRGLLLHPNHHWYVSAAMTDDDVDAALEATAAGFRAAERAAHG